MSFPKGINYGAHLLAKMPFLSPVRVLKKAADYTVTWDDCGKVITNNNATGTVTFTLPPLKEGQQYFFVSLVNQNLAVTSANASVMVGSNNTAANTCTFSTSNQKSGACVWVACTGGNWVAIPLGGFTLTMS